MITKWGRLNFWKDLGRGKRKKGKKKRWDLLLGEQREKEKGRQERFLVSTYFTLQKQALRFYLNTIFTK